MPVADVLFQTHFHTNDSVHWYCERPLIRMNPTPPSLFIVACHGD
nr:MAG TPA: hypothetical protein [Caudoviricetes sp.]